MTVAVSPDSLAFRIYQQPVVEEQFTCNYELNPDFRERLEEAGLKISGNGEDGSARIIELPTHPFFLATGYVPQLSSQENSPHPLITAFMKAAVEYKGDISG